MSEADEADLSPKQRQIFRLLNYSESPEKRVAAKPSDRKSNRGRTSYVVNPQTSADISPQTYEKKYTQIERNHSTRILTVGNQRELRFYQLCRYFNDPGRYHLVRNTEMRHSPSPHPRAHSRSSSQDQEERAADSCTLVALTQKRAYQRSRSPTAQANGRSSFISKPQTSVDVSPLSYNTAKTVHAVGIKLKYGTRDRTIEREIRFNKSVSPAQYTLRSDFDRSAGHEIYHNNRVNRWYLENMGFDYRHENDKYYDSKTSLARPTPIIYTQDRFKQLDTRRENVFLGPGSHDVRRL